MNKELAKIDPVTGWTIGMKLIMETIQEVASGDKEIGVDYSLTSFGEALLENTTNHFESLAAESEVEG